jgi:hypothetical protein
MIACSIQKTLFAEAVVAEALAAIHNVEPCKEMCFFFFFFFNIILEGYALQVVNAVNMEIKLQLEQNGSSYRWNQRRFGQVKIMKG